MLKITGRLPQGGSIDASIPTSVPLKEQRQRFEKLIEIAEAEFKFYFEEEEAKKSAKNPS